MPYVDANGIELCYESMGEGPPLVLIMGIGAQLIYWQDDFCRALANEGFRVIRFDNRDVGLSSKLSDGGVPSVRSLVVRAVLGMPVHAPYTLLDMADDVAGLLDALEIPSAHVVGASMGGMVAQTLTITHPHRVRSLTSIMSHSGERTDAFAHPRALRVLLGPAPRSVEQAMDNAEKFYRTVGSTGFELDVDGARERAGRAYQRCFYPKGFVRQLAAILASPRRTPALRFVRKPALVIHGTSDILIRPSGGRRTAAAIAGAELELIDGMGHDLPRQAWPRIVGRIAALARSA